MSDPPKQPFSPMVPVPWCLRGCRWFPVPAGGSGDSFCDGQLARGPHLAGMAKSCLTSWGAPAPPASHPISQPGGLIPPHGVGSVSAEGFCLPAWFWVNFFCTLHSSPIPPPPLPLLYPLFVPMRHFTIKLGTTCASAGRAPGLAARGLVRGRGEEGGNAGRQPPECPGSVGWGAPKAGAPGGEQKLETGSVCGLHDNKGRGGLHS